MDTTAIMDELKRMMREQFNIDVDNIQVHEPVHTQRLVFAIAGFDWPTGSVLIPEVQSTYEDIIAPLVKNRSDITFSIGFRKVGSSRVRLFRPNTVNWGKLIDECPADIYLSQSCALLSYQFKSPEVAVLTVVVSENSRQAHTIQCHVSIDDLFDGPVSTDYQVKFVNHAKRLYRLIRGVNGFITVSDRMSAISVGLDTPEERAAGLSYYKSSPAFRKRVRGSFWGNFLSPHHVELLGGEGVMQTAPAEIIERLDDGSYYLQISKDMHKVNNQQMQRLKQFLYPVLPKKETSCK